MLRVGLGGLGNGIGRLVCAHPAKMVAKPTSRVISESVTITLALNLRDRSSARGIPIEQLLYSIGDGIS